MSATKRALKRAKTERGKGKGDMWIPLAKLQTMDEKKANTAYNRQYTYSLIYAMDHLVNTLSSPCYFKWTPEFRPVAELQWGLLLLKELCEYKLANYNKPWLEIKNYITNKGHFACKNSSCWCKTFLSLMWFRSFPRHIADASNIYEVSSKKHDKMLPHVVDKIIFRRPALLLLLCARKWTAACPFYAGDGATVPVPFVPGDIFKFILRLADIVGPVVLLDDKGEFLPWCIPDAVDTK